MALNDNYNNGYSGKGNGSYDNTDKRPTSYSNYTSLLRVDGVDPSRVSIDYFSNIMKISIAPLIKGSAEAGTAQYDYKQSISIYLRQNEARILRNEIENFKADPIKNNNCGVPARGAVLTINNGKDYGTECPCIIIRKITDDGSVDSEYLYECNVANMYAIRGYVAKTGKFEKVTEPYKFVELDHIIEHLDAYLASSTVAYAHVNLDNSRFVNNRTGSKLDAIASKMGITFNKGGTTGNRGGSSYFDKSGSGASTSSYESGSLDDLD